MFYYNLVFYLCIKLYYKILMSIKVWGEIDDFGVMFGGRIEVENII